jgi:hypothetical protein
MGTKSEGQFVDVVEDRWWKNVRKAVCVDIVENTAG